LYIRENKEKFKIEYIEAPAKLSRKDIRLTVDYPEDLIVCRAVYENFKAFAPNIPLLDVVDYLDNNIQLLKITSPFCEQGYKNMYL
jgi:spore coat polysaccharide biosynthesis protein SpsF (cytidylyltransferase family)